MAKAKQNIFSSKKLDADVLALARVVCSSISSSEQRHGLLRLCEPPGRRPHQLPVRSRQRAARGVPGPAVQLVERQHGRAVAAEARVARPGKQQLSPLRERPPEDEGAPRG